MKKIKKEKDIKKIEEKKPKKKSKFKKWVILAILIAIVALAIKTAISIHHWQEMALSMLQNEPSQILDSKGEVIAKIGSERNRQNVSFSQMPDELKQAYVAIEDERF